MFYVNRMPHPTILKTDRQAVLMSAMMERDGHTVTRKIFSALQSGILIYNYDVATRAGILFQWCNVCGDYKIASDFHYSLDGKMQVCKSCVASKKRAKKYSQDVGLTYLSDKGQYDDIVIDAPDEIIEKLKFSTGKYKIVKVDDINAEGS